MGNYKKNKNQKDIDDEVAGSYDASTMRDVFKQTIADAALKSNVSSILDNASSGEMDQTLWKTDNILSFASFCESADHMNFPPLSPRQRMVAEYMFGDNPKDIFSSGRNTACLVWGKGSGKDTLAALMKLYIVYVLLNLKNPQRYLGLPDNDSIDLLNIAASKEQAQTVYFQIFKTKVLNWAWLRNQWDIVINGRFFSSGQDEESDFMNKVTVTNDAVLFPMNIRCFSGSAEAESLEGKNLLCFVLDEADAFKQKSMQRSAAKLYRVVRTSAVSRFGSKYKGFLISYPRSESGFIMKMYEQSKRFLNMYGDIAATWEVKPREMYSKNTFEFEGKKIPMDFYDEFRLDPLGSKAAYLCDPPAAESVFLEDQDKIDLATKDFVKPLFDFRDFNMDGKVRKVVTHAPFMHDRGVQHVLTLDLSLKDDATALTLMHREADRIVVDFSTAWIPDRKEGIEVDLMNVEEIIDLIRRDVNVKFFGADRWNSALLVQKLRSKGLNAEVQRLEFSDFEIFKRLLYAGNIVIPKHSRLINELKGLQLVSPQRVDHPDGQHNDMAVTLVMGVKMLLAEKVLGGGSGLISEGEFVGENLADGSDPAEFQESAPTEGIQIDGFSM